MKDRPRLSRGALGRIGAAVLIVTLVPLAGRPVEGAAQSGYASDEFTVSKKDNNQYRPRISGKNVVWQDYRNLTGRTYGDATANADIYGRDIEGNTDFKVTTNGTAARPAVSGSRVVWTDSRTVGNSLDIRGFNIDSGDTFDVVQKAGDQDYAAIDGNLVVWQDNRGGNWDIRGYDIDKDDNFDVSVRDGDQIHPAISGRVVVWEDYRRSASEPEIYFRNMDTDDTGRISDNNGDSRDPAISGDWVTWRTGDPNSEDQRVRLYNLKTKETRKVGDSNKLAGGPRISGNLVVWADERNGEDFNIWGYDIANDTQFRLTGADRDQMAPDISGKVAVWADDRGDTRDIRGSHLTIPASAAPTSSTGAPPVQAGPCGYQLGFKAVHDQIPAIVGDCITDEYHNPDNGDGLQQTAGGLLVWRKADNWTAFTNGSITWLNGPCGLQTRPNQGPFFSWEGRVGAGC